MSGDRLSAVGSVADGAPDKLRLPGGGPATVARGAAMTPRRSRATLGTVRGGSDSNAPRLSFGYADGGDLEIVSLRVRSKAEEMQVSDYVRGVMPRLSKPRTLTRRRQVVAAMLEAAKLVGPPLDATDTAHLYEWARVE